MRKLAVFFPGIGYTVDMPLLHYSRRLAASRGYGIKLLPYGGFPQGVRGDREKMAACWQLALTQAEAMLADVDLTAYDDVLFVGKSIGTIVAARLAARSPAADRIRLVLYTPTEDTFVYPFDRAVVFTGDADPWVGGADSRIPELCRQRGIPCIRIPQANHSLESGDCLRDIRMLSLVMEETARFTDGAQVTPLRPDDTGSKP